ncbi:hypothetical protein ATY75_13785 [Rhizobium sp. N122]|nr:hypothetical protein ATY75_13785 [Rhizobium sp. N122]
MSAIFDSFSKFGGTIDQSRKAGEAEKEKIRGAQACRNDVDPTSWRGRLTIIKKDLIQFTVN